MARDAIEMDMIPIPLSDSEKQKLRQIKAILSTDNANQCNDFAHFRSKENASKNLNFVKLKQICKLLRSDSIAKKLIMAEPDEVPWQEGLGKIEIIARILFEELA